MTLTSATLGQLLERKTRTVEIGDVSIIIQKPSPMQYSRYQMALVGDDMKPKLDNYGRAGMLLVALMAVDSDGNRLFGDDEIDMVDQLDLAIYTPLAEACQAFASNGKEASASLGESEQTTDSDLPAVSA